MLYGTSACHLCEQAEQLLLPWVAKGALIELVDVVDDDQVFALYGLAIPVVQREDGEILSWPFDANMIDSFLTPESIQQ